MKYRSRISVLLATILFVTLSLPLALDGKDLFTRSIVAGVIYILIMLMCFSVFVLINYTIKDNNLIVKMYLFNMGTIDIKRIKTIKSSYNPLSSPAASLRRLEVKYYSKGNLETALISPVREAEFIEKLKEINPNIKIDISKKRNILRFWDWDI